MRENVFSVTRYLVTSDRPFLELPVLRLGLAGFSAEQQTLIVAVLKKLVTGLRWEITALTRADAWCVNGSCVEVLPDGSLLIGSPATGALPFRINLGEADRPIAFSVPLSTDRLESVLTFDLGSQQSMQAMLDRFQGWLRPLTVQLCLASHIAQENIDLNSGVFHVILNGRLQAIVSQRGGVGVLPIADPSELGSASWARRPEFADEMPAHFLRISFAQLMWQYAMRTQRDVLPARFRTGRIYWRGPPQLPHRLLTDTHLTVVRELARGPATFRDLARRTQLAEVQLARGLAALYMVGAVTTDGKRVPTRPAAPAVSDEASYDPGHTDAHLADGTAPAPFNALP